jgi:hypothetical protein
MTLVGNEVCHNRESGVFVFAGTQPRVADNRCFDNHHFGIAVRDVGTCPDLVRNRCEANMLSGMLLFHHGGAFLADNQCHDDQHWGLVITPDARPNPDLSELAVTNDFACNPRGVYVMTDQQLEDIGR